jgi:hypothetical protein
MPRRRQWPGFARPRPRTAVGGGERGGEGAGRLEFTSKNTSLCFGKGGGQAEIHLLVFDKLEFK